MFFTCGVRPCGLRVESKQRDRDKGAHTNKFEDSLPQFPCIMLFLCVVLSKIYVCRRRSVNTKLKNFKRS